MTSEVDAAIARYLAGEAADLRRRQHLRTAVELWGAEALPPGGPFPNAFTAPPVRPAAQPDIGNGNRHRRRKAAAKARH